MWTWVAIGTDTKLVPSFLVADRSAGSAFDFMQDVASRRSHRVQPTTDVADHLWATEEIVRLRD
jgi:hypothetical protein